MRVKRGRYSIILAVVIGLIAGLLLRSRGPSGKRYAPVYEEGELYRVIRVIDGDTIVLEGGEHLRYIGCDTPEMFYDDPARGLEPFAEEATETNRKLVAGKLVYLVFGRKRLDKYGRLLASVYVPVEGEEEGVLVSERLVELGLARVMGPSFSEDLYPRLKAAQDQARQDKRGIWGKRRAARAGAPFVASKHSQVYHAADCPLAERISPKNLTTFPDEETARASGRRPCSKCTGKSQ